jgi:hypothetical protein
MSTESENRYESPSPEKWVGKEIVYEDKQYTVIRAEYARGNLVYRYGPKAGQRVPLRRVYRLELDTSWPVEPGEKGVAASAYTCSQCGRLFDSCDSARLHLPRCPNRPVSTTPDKTVMDSNSFESMTVEELRRMFHAHRAVLSLIGRLADGANAEQKSTRKLIRSLRALAPEPGEG